MADEVLDDFNRASLGTHWTQSTSLSALVITGSTDVAGSGGTDSDNGSWYNSFFPSDHYSETVVGVNGTGANSGGPSVRHQPTASTFYLWGVDAGGNGQMWEVTSGTFVALGAAYSGITTTAGTIHRLDATGSTLTPSVNGSAQATRSDASITGGAPGIDIYHDVSGTKRTYTSWRAGLVYTNIFNTANPAGVTAVASVTTYSGVSIGDAAVDRTVVVVIGKEVATVVVNSVAVDGNAAILADGTTFGNVGAWCYYLSVPGGATADIVITWSGAITNIQNHIAVYSVTGAGLPPIAGNNTSTDMDITAPLTTGSSIIPPDGGMLAIAACATDNTAKTWAQLTKNLDVDAGDFRFTTAASAVAGTATRTCTGAANEDGVLVWVIFSKSFLPTLLMPPPLPPRRMQ